MKNVLPSSNLSATLLCGLPKAGTSGNSFWKAMHAAGPKNPLHGITLEKMLIDLEAHYGWEMLGRMIKINCFNFHPSIKSSLTFLRRTPWARAKVEELYLHTLPDFGTPPLSEDETGDT